MAVPVAGWPKRPPGAGVDGVEEDVPALVFPKIDVCGFAGDVKPRVLVEKHK